MASQCQQADSPRRFRWQLVNTRNPKASVIRPARPDSAKEDLRKFVKVNQLQYRHKRQDDFADLENMFALLRLDEDDELLDRAERRDLPASVQLAARREATRDNRQMPPSRPERVFSVLPTSSRSKAVPNRRSVRPDTIHDDYAFRRYNQGSELKTGVPADNLQKHGRRTPIHGSLSTSYMSLVTFDQSFPLRTNGECPYCDGSQEHSSEETCPLKELHKYPDLVVDDVLNRRIRQSSAARVAPPQPPFGIPNSSVNCFIHTFPQSDYSHIKPEQDELRQRFRIPEREPHLVHDDMAFRSLRKDYHLGYKLTEDDFWHSQVLDRSVSSPNLAIKNLRITLRPVKPSSLTSSPSQLSDSSSPSTATSPILDTSNSNYLPRILSCLDS